ncbi:hypothetical protein Q5O14_03335 [Eubacteriaceae bacterium ES2]|nr:hypothetical protein Q5O14_03335 [Eubacteriaceae bacterium ES2]
MTDMEILMDMAKKNIYSNFLPNDQAIDAFSVFIILKMLQS